VAQLQAELDTLARRLAQQFPTTNAGLSFGATSFREIYTGDVRPYLLVLMSAVSLVLLIACANVVNLMLSRAVSREREIAVMTALGAGRFAIFRQLMTESAVLTAFAGATGIALAVWTMKFLRAFVGARLPDWMTIDIDGRVLGFTLIASVVTGLISGLAPALHALRAAPGASLTGTRGASHGRVAASLRDAMIVIEAAVAVVLLVGTGLVIRGFLELQAQDKGFRAESVASFRIALGWRRYSGDAVVRYYERAVEQLRSIPGVDAVGFVYSPPLAGLEFSAPNTVQADGQSLSDALRNPYVHPQSTGDGYFTVMRIPLLAGRMFSSFDRKDAEQVAIVSERLARLLWPGQTALGKRLRYNPLDDQPNPYRTVVGVVGNVQHYELGGEPSLDLYVPFRQTTQANQFMLVKTTLPLVELQRRAEDALYAIDPDQSAFDFRTYEQRVLATIWQLRLSRLLLLVFGGVAIVLSAIGLYGVMAFLVGQRTREMAIRAALGATPADISGLILKRGLFLAVCGAAVGVAGSVPFGRILAHGARGVPASDSLSLAAAVMLLLTAMAVACAGPAWRASRSDPAITLRAE
jgi:putative ABC transport system permease protein